MAQGPLQQTGNPLDLAIEGQGFFAIQTPMAFATRATAAFIVRRTGNLVTAGERTGAVLNRPADLDPTGRGCRRGQTG